jgi:hypothetical protein
MWSVVRPGRIAIVIALGLRSTCLRTPAIVSTAGTFDATTSRTRRAVGATCAGAFATV